MCYWVCTSDANLVHWVCATEFVPLFNDKKIPKTNYYFFVIDRIEHALYTFRQSCLILHMHNAQTLWWCCYMVQRVQGEARLHTLIRDAFWQWQYGVLLRCFNANCINLNIHCDMCSARISFFIVEQHIHSSRGPVTQVFPTICFELGSLNTAADALPMRPWKYPVTQVPMKEVGCRQTDILQTE